MWRTIIVAVFLIATTLAKSQQAQQTSPPPSQTRQPPNAPVGKLTPLAPTHQKPSPCKQSAKTLADATAKLLAQNQSLEDENQRLSQENQRLALLSSTQQSALDKASESMKEGEELYDKQQQLMDKTTKDAFAAGMAFSEIHGKWAIQTPTMKVTCIVQVYDEYHTIELSNCQ
jgi:hypothetical protein